MNLFILLWALSAIAFTTATDVTVTVQMVYPQQAIGPDQSVGLRGSAPLSWETSLLMKNTDTNTWTTQFTVRGLNATQPSWTLGIKTIVSENIWEIGANEVITISQSDTNKLIKVYPYYTTAKGAQQTITKVYSPQLNNTRDVWLYIPPAMVENPLRWEKNVLIMHDGQNLAPLWNVPTTLDDLIVGGKMESVFIIGPYNTDGNRINEYTYGPDPNYGGGEGDLYLDFLEQTLIPLVKSQFQILTAKENLGTLGSSLGGLISCYAGVTRPHVYSKLGCMSSSFWWDYRNFSKWVVPKLKKENVATQTYYMDSGDSGDSDDGRPDTSQVASQFVQAGFELGTNFYWYLQRGGQHNEYYWSKRFHHPMQWMYYHDGIWNGPWSG